MAQQQGKQARDEPPERVIIHLKKDLAPEQYAKFLRHMARLHVSGARLAFIFITFGLDNYRRALAGDEDAPE